MSMNSQGLHSADDMGKGPVTDSSVFPRRLVFQVPDSQLCQDSRPERQCRLVDVETWMMRNPLRPPECPRAQCQVAARGLLCVVAHAFQARVQHGPDSLVPEPQSHRR